ncbi:MAG TPA: 3-deoxy-7-phosphoheptulonate synthase [Anaerolineales bacterium]|jgi:3-deoxy-7-phosphoheptulonate synthase|nr:3-deoxy-7-phosphoheptulonate synthase [Anaerolineales bacterium]HQX15488.1 3-deoxy-7-phosphoheptulonate synthase [Anaerolineales bacterium]
MIIVMKPHYTPQQLEGVVNVIKQHGLTPHITYGVETAIVAAVGEVNIPSLDPFEILDGVETVKRISQPFKLGSRQVHPENSVFPIDGFHVGGDDIVIIAGPCAVESKSQILETAHAVREAGANALRGGVFKPRTSPYAFQGLGEEGLEYLAEAREQTGMPIVVEIMSQVQLDLMLKYVDVFQVGARNMQNFNLLRMLGETRKSVLLKRGLSATIEELLMSAEYLLAGGNKQVILCERGIRTFETSTRNTTDINAIPVLKNLTHLPVILDPSHATGHFDYVAPIARAGIAAGADGIIVEVHPDPAHAASDGKQSLKPEKFAEMVKQVKAIAEVMGRRIAPVNKPVTAGW